MSLRLYLDECAYRKRLVSVLRGEPYAHHVVTPVDAGLLGRPDPEQLAYTRQHDLVLITKNPRDFEALHRERPDHPGILAIYQDNRRSDMSDTDIARAIQNLIDAEVTLPVPFLRSTPGATDHAPTRLDDCLATIGLEDKFSIRQWSVVGLGHLNVRELPTVLDLPYHCKP